MSWYEPRAVNCPGCGQENEVACADTINVGRMPKAREEILSGSFHRFSCSHCGRAFVVDCAFLYTDVKRQVYVHVVPSAGIADWPHWEEVAAGAFFDAFIPGPPAIEALARRFTVRVVFGREGLREKLRIWDAGLSDPLVELLKLELRNSEPALERLAQLELTVAGVSGDYIEVDADGRELRKRYGMSLRRYRELEAERAGLEQKFPGLFFKPFVSYGRLMNERLIEEAP